MSRNPIVVRTVPALRRALDGLRARKATVALVPTMGALHDGHVSLVRLAKRRAQKVVVSIFVNPAQFAPTEDFGAYPRTWQADIARRDRIATGAQEGGELVTSCHGPIRSRHARWRRSGIATREPERR